MRIQTLLINTTLILELKAIEAISGEKRNDPQEKINNVLNYIINNNLIGEHFSVIQKMLNS